MTEIEMAEWCEDIARRICESCTIHFDDLDCKALTGIAAYIRHIEEMKKRKIVYEDSSEWTVGEFIANEEEWDAKERLTQIDTSARKETK